jgi:large subunit ribosomal protein L37Ae
MVSRYGKKIRERVNAVKALRRAGHACPKCGKKSLKRDSNSKWRCNSCRAVFAGGAYEPETMVGSSVRKTVEALKNVKLSAKE